MHIPKWLIATAGVLFVILVAAIAFLIGRQSGTPPAPASATTAAVEAPPAAREETGQAAVAPIVTPPAIVVAPSQSATMPSSASAPVPATATDTPPITADARARVAAYFSQMDSIQSAGTTGDPEEFATTMLGAAVSGDFSGIDALVRAAGDAERRAAAVQPPGECAEYHRQALAMLQESKALVTTLRDGLKRNDANVLTSVGASAQAMKSRADSLAAAEKSLRARFGL